MLIPPMYLFEDSTHTALREQVRRFAAEAIAPFSAEWEEQEEFSIGLYQQAAAAGITGIGYPEELGGCGGEIGHVLVAGEELILAGRSVGTVAGLGSHGIALPPILISGTSEQQQRFIPPVLRGEKIAALAITEPGAGSDVAGLTTRAEKVDGGYLVSGTKTFITSGARADLVTVAVRTGEAGHGGISMLVVEKNFKGFSVSRRLKKTGWWPSDTAELYFDACFVPDANLIGEEGSGFLTIVQNFVNERLLLAGQCVAIAQLALNESIFWARERKAFGKALVGQQVIRHKLAEMDTKLAAARALVGEVAIRKGRGEAVVELAAMAKNTATDMCSFVCDQAVQIHGGMGYMRECLVERLYRDARLYPIGGGTREVMNELVARFKGYSA
jgi:acyl-CoA dehydrogenase